MAMKFANGLGYAVASTALAVAMTGSAFAQEADADDAASNDEIVVTARYRTESLQDVPQAISAYNEASLQKIAARDLTDLAPAAPNVNIQPVATFPNSASIHIRGLGAQGIESTEESPVGVLIDGVFITRPVATLLDTFDMARAEILRGPQGTSFGKNSLAGGIAAYSKDPTGDWGFEAEGTIGNYGRLDVKGAVNVPLAGERLALRVMANKETNEGWFTNRVNGDDVGGKDRLTIRASLLAKPSDNLTVNLKGWIVRDRSSAPGGDAVRDPTKLLATVFRFNEPNDGFYTIGRDFPTLHQTDQKGVIGKVEADLGAATVTSITGYIKTDDFNDSDFDQTEVFFFPTFRLQTHKQFSEELRVQADIADTVNIVVGGYYLDQSFAMSQAFPTLPLLVTFQPFGSQDFVTQDNVAKALFGQAIFKATDRLNVTLGVRQSWESKDFFRDPTGVLISPARFTSRSFVKPLSEMRTIADANFALGRAIKDSYDRSRMTFKAGVDYKVTDDVMVYGTYSQGYKGGGYGARAATLTTAGPTDDNTSELFEAGLKGDFFDNKLRFNLTGFVTKFKKLEFGVFFPNPSVASGQETASLNIGAATTKGFELETVMRPTDNLSVSANIGYLKSKYTDFCADLDGPSAFATAPTSNCGGQVTRLPNGTYLVDMDQSGFRMTRAPKWQYQVAADYTIPLGSAGNLTARGAVLYKSTYYNTVANDLAGKAGDFAIVDGSLTWENESGMVRAMLWGKNLTGVTYVSALTPTAQFFVQRFYSPPRTYGLTLAFKY